jgi:hypothetical protein
MAQILLERMSRPDFEEVLMIGFLSIIDGAHLLIVLAVVLGPVVGVILALVAIVRAIASHLPSVLNRD